MRRSSAPGRCRGSASRVVDALVVAALSVLPATGMTAASFDPDLMPTGWVSRPVMSSADVRGGGQVIYRTAYSASTWSGTIRANHISAAGVVQASSPWTLLDTANALDASSVSASSRRIVTRHSDGSGVPFAWASLSSSQQAQLGNATTGPALLGFIRGDRGNESPNGLKYRQRASRQGDILHTTLVHWNHGGVKRLYAGGNDGMLHVFDAANGSEVFAYVPSMLLPRLSRLAAEPYVHTPYVDGGLHVAKVAASSGARTLLAGALGAGGKGLFLLDVSDPSPASQADAAKVVKWEVTPARTGFANLGYTYAAPRLARLQNGVAAVIVGNGYLNGGSGRASLFVIDADSGARICESDTGAGSTTSPNGLSTATLADTDGDGKVDYAFAGDLDGNLWKFDLRGVSTPACTASKVMSTSPARAITTAPVVVRHPSGGLLVIAATGRILSAADASDTRVHHVYGVWVGAPSANNSWLEQSLTEVSVDGKRMRTVTSAKPNWGSGGHRGWRLTLPAGERVVAASPFVNEDRYYFTGTNPTVEAADDTKPSGSVWQMEVDALTGGAPRSAVFDVNGDGRFDGGDAAGGGVVVGIHQGAGIASAPMLIDVTGGSLTLLNQQADVTFDPPPPEPATGGVSGGHFDLDFYFLSGSKYANVDHTHEYDDLYNVTGVNFLAPSEAVMRLGSKLSPGVAFKVLLVNQYLNPAVRVTVGGAGYQTVKVYGAQASTTDAATMLTQQPSYTLATVQTLGFNLPLDGFKSKDWWGDGKPARAGLIPTQTGCVNKVSSEGVPSKPGPNGERYNGAFTVQIIKAETPASALELNYPGGGPSYGWRVSKAQFVQWVLAEYTVFWHHPNKKCYGDSGWVANAAEDFEPGDKTATPAAGSSDPKDGNFGSTPSGVSVVGTTTTVSGNTVTQVITYSDGKTHRTEVTRSGNGVETYTITDRDGVVTTGTRMSQDRAGSGLLERVMPSARINWREAVRQ